MSTNPTHTPPPIIHHTSLPLVTRVTILVILFLPIGFISICICRCIIHNLFYMWHIRHNPSRTHRRNSMHPGLDPLIINSFPTFTYSSVKEYRKENYGLECAICLCEFKDDNVLRLLTKCYHVFHQECIDLWLGSHKSCPCCRCSLDTPINSPEKSPNLAISSSRHEAHENDRGDSVAIDVKDDNNESIVDKSESKEEKHVVVEVAADRGENKTTDGMMTRCKSTGHSIAKNTRGRENDDRYMLRLPQDVQEKLIPRHNWTRSCTEFGEYKSKTSSSNVGFGEETLERDKHNEQRVC